MEHQICMQGMLMHLPCHSTEKYIHTDILLCIVHVLTCMPRYIYTGVGMEYFRQQGVPVTEMLTSFYYENFIGFGMGPKSHGEGQPKAITFNMADKPLPMVAVDDIGKFAAKLFEDETTVGQTHGAASAHLTGQQMVRVWLACVFFLCFFFRSQYTGTRLCVWLSMQCWNLASVVCMHMLTQKNIQQCVYAHTFIHT